jgi:hypothetical protein
MRRGRHVAIEPYHPATRRVTGCFIGPAKKYCGAMRRLAAISAGPASQAENGHLPLVESCALLITIAHNAFEKRQISPKKRRKKSAK